MNKGSGGDGIPAELFHILKDDAVKVLHSICQQIWKTQQWPQDLKRSVFIHSSHTLASNAQNSPSQTSTVNHELPDVQDGFGKGRGTRDQIVYNCRRIEKARKF